ncbi:NAD(P)H-hydrate dehydratase [Stappia sp.]|uniref:NAD(P)H-hydrate dehydratase n=1 Tax=Stappia sp. TaxID=1870903 RepID=UPI003D0C0E25
MNELLSPERMAEADALAVAGGTPGIELMRRAGLAVADACTRMVPLAARVLVLAGPGNNGGDGFVAATVLRRRGYRVEVLLLGARERITGDAALALEEMEAAGIACTPLTAGGVAASLATAGIVVDALFGAGLARPLSGVAAEAVGLVNLAERPVLSVDLPSGVEGAGGTVLGTAVAADRTVTFFRGKPGHYLFPGRQLRGRLEIADIGIPDEVLQSVHTGDPERTWRNDPALWSAALRAPNAGGHKYARGHAVVVSGSALSTGAARLAAGAALRSGAGLVTVATPPSAALVNAMHLTAVMVRKFQGKDGLGDLLADRRLNAVAIGPGAGAGAGTRELALVALASGLRAVVLDADALTAFEDASGQLAQAIAARSGKRARDVVLTPHEGEFARLFGDADWAGVPSKLTRARAAARLAGGVVVLKGADTVVAAPDGRAVVNDNAPAWLATAGSGDVLCGIVTGLLAQGVPAFEAAVAGVWLHGRSGVLAGPALTAEDLEPALRLALGEHFAG